ncbi:FMN-binding negative transcriptional regulator [Rhizobium sp. P38BS-XIX]|uniref:FMN-binding negative transcriptional regulator n=1 Tax=Rhizobium sp. P38BS-XIX TaxID=2726740 RepID=UPI00145780EF|nr:FMN-binding negative transcriptional regulator [Rhizobium sp. P38BS-XIX]NLS01444.1 FMN-binding negative transcriptional regulator [Rhizobium sp. P38BS-XIX]
MYQPPHHREDDLGTQHQLIRAHPLGMLITAGDGGLIANAVPFHLNTSLSPKGTLQAHLARANGQWKEIAAGAPVLVVFQGADTYITPSWYATKRETGKVVPTWNYAIVQVRGSARTIEDPAWLRTQIDALTGENESDRAQPWAVDDAPPEFVSAQLKGIIGIEIDIETIDGKWKVSQNRPIADRQGVAEGLSAIDRTEAAEMADLVRRYGK